MKILTYLMPFLHKAKVFPRLLFLSGIVACWFGNAVSAFANDSNCQAIYSVSPNGSASLHVPCVVLGSASDDTVYEFDLIQVSGGEPLSFAIVDRKPTIGAVSGAKATFNEATGIIFLPLVEAHIAGQVEHYAVQMKTVSPSSANETRLVVSSKTLLASASNNPSVRKKEKKEDKVAVCHIPQGNPAEAHTINISMKTYEKSHKKHGDTLGECGSSSSDDQGNTGDADTGTDNTVITAPDSFIVIAKEKDGDEVEIRSLTGEFISSFSTGGHGKDISVATGDFDGDGIDDVVVDLKKELNIFTIDGTELNSFKIKKEIKGDIAVGDINGDGQPEIIIASKKSHDGNVYIYAADGTELDTIELFEKEKDVSLASADVTGDGMDDIIGGGDHKGHKSKGDNVSVYNVATQEYVTFSVFDEEPNKGKKHHDEVNVAAGNVVGDDIAEIVVATAKKGGRVEIYSGEGTFIKGFEAFDGKKGIVIAVGNVSGDAHAEIIVAEPEGDEIRIFDADGKLLASLPGLDIEEKKGKKKGKGKGKIVGLAIGQGVLVTVDDDSSDDGTGTDGTDNTGSDGNGTGSDTGTDNTGSDGTDNTGSDGTGTDGTVNTDTGYTGTDMDEPVIFEVQYPNNQTYALENDIVTITGINLSSISHLKINDANVNIESLTDTSATFLVTKYFALGRIAAFSSDEASNSLPIFIGRKITGMVILPENSIYSFSDLKVEYIGIESDIDDSGNFSLVVKNNKSSSITIFTPENTDEKISVYLSALVLADDDNIVVDIKSTAVDIMFSSFNAELATNGIKSQLVDLIKDNVNDFYEDLIKGLDNNPYYLIDRSSSYSENFVKSHNEVTEMIRNTRRRTRSISVGKDVDDEGRWTDLEGFRVKKLGDPINGKIEISNDTFLFAGYKITERNSFKIIKDYASEIYEGKFLSPLDDSFFLYRSYDTTHDVKYQSCDVEILTPRIPIGENLTWDSSGNENVSISSYEAKLFYLTLFNQVLVPHTLEAIFGKMGNERIQERILTSALEVIIQDILKNVQVHAKFKEALEYYSNLTQYEQIELSALFGAKVISTQNLANPFYRPTILDNFLSSNENYREMHKKVKEAYALIEEEFYANFFTNLIKIGGITTETAIEIFVKLGIKVTIRAASGGTVIIAKEVTAALDDVLIIWDYITTKNKIMFLVNFPINITKIEPVEIENDGLLKTVYIEGTDLDSFCTNEDYQFHDSWIPDSVCVEWHSPQVRYSSNGFSETTDLKKSEGKYYFDINSAFIENAADRIKVEIIHDHLDLQQWNEVVPITVNAPEDIIIVDNVTDGSISSTEITVTVETFGEGQGYVVSTPSGIECGTTTNSSLGNCTHTFNGNGSISVELKAIEMDGRFSGWSGTSCNSLDSTCTVTGENASFGISARFDSLNDTGSTDDTTTPEPDIQPNQNNETEYVAAIGGTCPAAGVYIADEWYYFKCECTSYVAWNLNKNGIEFTNWYKGNHWSNAKTWQQAAINSSVPVDNTPQVGDVAWWDAWNDDEGKYGHVAYVESVNADGTVNISEYNFGAPHGYGTRNNITADAYIHVGPSLPSVTPPVPPVPSSTNCSGNACNGLNPEATNCSTGAITAGGPNDIYATLNGVNQKVGTVELRWSSTCQTNWSRVIRTDGATGESVMARIIRDDGVQQFRELTIAPASEWTDGQDRIWSPMVYAPDNCSAYAQGMIDFSFTSSEFVIASQSGCSGNETPTPEPDPLPTTPSPDVCTPSVNSVSPQTVTLDETTTFTVSGSCLPDTTAFWIGECANLVSKGGNSQTRYFECTPSYTAGTKDGVVKDQAGGTVLHNFNVNVQQAPSSSTSSCSVGQVENCNGGCTNDSWIGDNYCDAELHCAALNNDGGDCGGSQSSSTTSSCSAGQVEDCNGGCSNDSWIGDSYCDAELNCSAFNNDGGDCGSQSSSTSSCSAGQVENCDGGCTDESWIGDNDCDAELHCSAFNNDGGDCNTSSTSTSSTPTVGASCGSGSVYDCSLQCTDEADIQGWIGDGYCDDGTYDVVLTCPFFDNDGGDCESSSSSSSSSSCEPYVNSVSPLSVTYEQTTTFTVQGGCLPDTTAFWIGECANLVSQGGNSQTRSFTCTPSYSTGIKEGVVKTQSGGTVLLDFTVDVNW